MHVSDSNDKRRTPALQSVLVMKMLLSLGPRTRMLTRTFPSNYVHETQLSGYNGTVFVYGQTGSGKSHTMMGQLGQGPEHMGITPRMVESVFQYIQDAPEHIEFTVRNHFLLLFVMDVKRLVSDCIAFASV
jgi:hypothetical protein